MLGLDEQEFCNFDSLFFIDLKNFNFIRTFRLQRALRQLFR